MARNKTPKTCVSPTHEREIGRANMAKVLSQRDNLLKECMRHSTEREALEKMVALYFNEKNELLLECNMMRESLLQQRMLLQAEQMEIDVQRMRVVAERGVLHELLTSLDAENQRRCIRR
jgi:hypothetical protein